MILGILRTHIIEDRSQEVPEGGFFEVEVSADEIMVKASHDPTGYIKSMISSHLAAAVDQTTVPVDLWTFESSPRLIRRYNFPAYLDFGGYTR